MEVRVAETLSLIVNSEEIDLKKAIHSGGLEVKIDTNGGASVKYSGGKQGVNLKGLDLVGLNKDLFKKLNVGLKRNDAGGVDWSVRVGSKGNYVKLKGSLDLNPMNGILGPSLERMKNTSAGNL